MGRTTSDCPNPVEERGEEADFVRRACASLVKLDQFSLLRESRRATKEEKERRRTANLVHARDDCFRRGEALGEGLVFDGDSRGEAEPA